MASGAVSEYWDTGPGMNLEYLNNNVAQTL